MTSTKEKLILLVVASGLIGCAGTPQAARDGGRAIAPTQASVSQQADTYRRELPALLGMPSDRIRIELGSEAIQVNIIGVTAAAERQAILNKFQEFMWQYADAHQQASMSRLSFKD